MQSANNHDDEDRDGDVWESWDTLEDVSSTPEENPPNDYEPWSQSVENTTTAKEREAEAEENPRGINLLGLGTLMIFGAVSANVFAFRRSRWAVGKELYRAWERRERARNAAAGASKAGYRTKYSTAAEAAHAAAAAADEAVAAAKARTRGGQGGGGESYWESWGSSSRGTWRASGRRIEFDGAELEEMLRKMHGDNSRRRSDGAPSDDMFEELFRRMGDTRRGGQHVGSGGLDEMLRAMQEAMMNERTRSSRPGSDADGQAFWEEVFGRQSGGFGDFGSTSGVHTRGDLFGNDRHYRALGLEPNVGMDVVKRRYRKLVMQWHPDRYRGNDREGAERRFQEISQAYEALTKR